MKDTQNELRNSLKTTPATIQKKSTNLPVIDMEQAKTRLSLVADDAFQYNQRTGGKMSIHATQEGLLIIVASLPYHKLGVADTDSGKVITIDGVPVE